jgi:hypothetical protein
MPTVLPQRIAQCRFKPLFPCVVEFIDGMFKYGDRREVPHILKLRSLLVTENEYQKTSRLSPGFPGFPGLRWKHPVPMFHARNVA